jgi:hypothetical protein
VGIAGNSEGCKAECALIAVINPDPNLYLALNPAPNPNLPLTLVCSANCGVPEEKEKDED